MAQITNNPIRVGVNGAAGKMGREVVKTILEASDMTLVMAVDVGHIGQDAALVSGLSQPSGVTIEDNLTEALKTHQPQVVVDFTSPAAVFQNAQCLIAAGVRPVIGTTGLSKAQIDELAHQTEQQHSATLIVPNFAIGAVLLMKFAQEASRYFTHAEIIELHHNQKHDAPSGTALRTAALMEQVQPHFATTNIDDTELLPGARGARTEGNIHIHSVRLPGLVAHQTVLFGGPGETLTIRHDSLDRSSFMPGVALAIRRIGDLKGLICGLEHIL